MVTPMIRAEIIAFLHAVERITNERVEIWVQIVETDQGSFQPHEERRPR